MTACALSQPHRFDPGLSLGANLFGREAGLADTAIPSCPTAFVGGLGLSAFALFAGAFAFGILHKRARRWAYGLAIGALGYWVLMKLALLNVLLGQHGTEPGYEPQRTDAVVSQAVFELIVAALILAFTLGLVRTFSRQGSAG